MTPVTRYMLYTNTVSHLLKKHPAVAHRVVAAPITSVCISAITQGELLLGLANRPDATALHGAVREFLRRADVLPWDAATSEVYGPIRAATQRAGRVVAADGSPDRLARSEHRRRSGEQRPRVCTASKPGC